jgi:hypothetical protein
MTSTLIAATVMCGAAATALGQLTYEPIPMPAGTFLGSFSTGIVGVSSDGRTVTGTAEVGAGLRGYRWRSGVGRSDYVSPAFPFFDIEASGISGDGTTVVGTANDNVTGAERTFRTRNDGAFELYTTPVGDNVLFRPRTNEDGSVLVASTVRRAVGGNPTSNRIARYSSPTSFEIIPAPSGANPTRNFFADVSGNAQRIVAVAEDTTRGNARFATVWREGVGASWLPVTPNTLESFALATSREGDFTAGVIAEAGAPNKLARWEGNELLTFNAPANRQSLTVSSISNDGSIIAGTLFGNGVNLGDVGFIWTPQTGIVEAKDYLVGIGVPFPVSSTIELRSVTKPVVSADGSTIAGFASLFNTTTGQFNSSYFRATIPAPTSLIACALGLSVSLRRRRHAV